MAITLLIALVLILPNASAGLAEANQTAVNTAGKATANVSGYVDATDCHTWFGDYRCTVSWFGTVTVDGVAVCGLLTGIVSASACNTLTTAYDNGESYKTYYGLSKTSAQATEDFKVCVRAVLNADEKCATGKITIFFPPAPATSTVGGAMTTPPEEHLAELAAFPGVYAQSAADGVVEYASGNAFGAAEGLLP